MSGRGGLLFAATSLAVGLLPFDRLVPGPAAAGGFAAGDDLRDDDDDEARPLDGMRRFNARHGPRKERARNESTEREGELLSDQRRGGADTQPVGSRVLLGERQA